MESHRNTAEACAALRPGRTPLMILAATIILMVVAWLSPSAKAAGPWSPQNSRTTEYLSGVHFTDANNGWSVGGAGPILTTSNGGATWAAQTSAAASFHLRAEKGSKRGQSR
jgi:photosystem II stability/assembly factor-like uncharacterized protein